MEGFTLPLDLKFKVLINCMTYNQMSYIKNALLSFVSQITNFPYLCLITDDASTDGEAEVILDFIHDECDSLNIKMWNSEDAVIYYASHKTNLNCNFVIYLLKRNLYRTEKKESMIDFWRDRCNYEAICEGDDYWIDPYKIQNQYDYMEGHPDCSLCCSDALILTEDKILNWRRYKKDCFIPIKDIILGGGLWIQTATFFVNTRMLKPWPQCCKDCHVKDYPLIIWAAINGNVYYMDKKTAAYRNCSKGSWTALDLSTFSEKSVEDWISELMMLDGLNQHSHFLYQKWFAKEKNKFVFTKIIGHPDNAQLIYEKMKEYIESSSFINRQCIEYLLKKEKGLCYKIYKNIGIHLIYRQ